jgi:toxin ParE1/3/4
MHAFPLVDAQCGLKVQPLIGKEVIESGNIDVRELVEGNYRITYKMVDNDRIDILIIHHCSRNFNPF